MSKLKRCYMLSPLNQPGEPFVEAYDLWDLDKLFQDLATADSALSDVPKKILRGALLGNPPRDIAKKCCYASDTVRQYLSQEIYPSIRLLLGLPSKHRLTALKLASELKGYRLESKKTPSKKNRFKLYTI